jgi:TRAP-type uncharacterized transport system fused permease subunit
MALFIVPAALTFISALLLIPKIRLWQCIVCFPLNALGLLLYYACFTESNFKDVDKAFGLYANVALACLAVVLPIVNLVFAKKKKRAEM